MRHYISKISILFFILNTKVFCIHSAPLFDGNDTKTDGLNGEKLMKLGKELNLPIFQMIGKTIYDVEKKLDDKINDYHPCLNWTEWSRCTRQIERFGSKFRTRECNVNKTVLRSNSQSSYSKTEKEVGICLNCPNGYNFTENGFCMKFDADNQISKDSAEQQCQKDGGHLVNIDSESKYNDVLSLLTGFGYAGIWIDGHRKDLKSAWEYTYGSQKGFFKWLPGQPNDTTNELCLVIAYLQNEITWHDAYCGTNFYSICEISYSV